MTNEPLISVIVPAYNHSQYIYAAIQSIVNQDYSELEIVVIDDGSSDNTAEVAKKALQQGGRPFRLICQDNIGAYSTINRGIQLAYGEYIAILNSDDRFLPGRLKIMLNALSTANKRFAFSMVSHIDLKGSPHPYQAHYLKQIEDARQFPTLTFELLRNNIAVTTGNFLFHRSLYDEIGGFAAYVTCHDWDFVLRVMLVEEPLFVEGILLEYRIHPQGTLQINLEKVDKEIEQVIMGYLLRVNEAKNLLAPGPSQWGDYWNLFCDNYLDRIRAYPRVSKQLELMRVKRTPIKDEIKNHLMIQALEYHTHRLQELEKQLSSLHTADPNRASPLAHLPSIENKINNRGISSNIFEPLDFTVDLDLTQVKLQIPAFQKDEKKHLRLLFMLPWMIMGGAERFALNLMDQLNRRGWQISVICTAPSDNVWRDEFLQRTGDIFVLPDFLPIKDYTRFLRYLIEVHDFDALLLQGSIEGYRFAPILHALFPNLPILDYLHFVTLDWMNGGFPRLSYVYRDGIDLTITSCQQVKYWMIEEGMEENRLRVCPIGVDVERWKPDIGSRGQIRLRLGIKEDEVVLIYAARLETQKQPFVFAETLHLLSAQGVQFRALVAGEGNLRPELERKIQFYGLGDRVYLLGAVASEEMPALLAAGDIFFLPSQNEGISSAVYEAMACGLPVVGANVGGQVELVTAQCGILAPSLPPEQQPAVYARALSELITDKERRMNMGAASRERILSGFTLDHMGNCIADILSEIIYLKQTSRLASSVLSSEEQIIRATQHVVEYLQARQEWKNLCLKYEDLLSKHEDLSHKYYELLQPRPPSYWFYLWIRQIFLLIFQPLKSGRLVQAIQKAVKGNLIKE